MPTLGWINRCQQEVETNISFVSPSIHLSQPSSIPSHPSGNIWLILPHWSYPVTHQTPWMTPSQSSSLSLEPPPHTPQCQQVKFPSRFAASRIPVLSPDEDPAQPSLCRGRVLPCISALFYIRIMHKWNTHWVGKLKPYSSEMFFKNIPSLSHNS